MIELGTITPGYKNQRALISINALIDIDIGLIELIKEQYLDPEVFDVEYLTKANTLDFIMATYFRKVDNPLYIIANDLHDKETLDDYYVEFMKTQYKEIYDRSVYTDVLGLINMLIDSNEIGVDILYYSDYAKEQLEADQEEGNLHSSLGFVNIKNLKSEADKYNEIYVRSIYELDNFKTEYFTTPKRFYISTFARNYDELGRMLKTEGLEKLVTAKLLHEVSQFSMYNTAIIRKDRPVEITETEGEELDDDDI